MGVQPYWPDEGVYIILGNDLTGALVWAEEVKLDRLRVPLSLEMKNTGAAQLQPLKVTVPEQGDSRV